MMLNGDWNDVLLFGLIQDVLRSAQFLGQEDKPPTPQKPQAKSKKDKILQKQLKLKNKQTPYMQAKLSGDCAYYQKDYLCALKHYTTALQHQESGNCLAKRGLVYTKLKQYQEGYSDALISLEMDDQNQLAQFVCGVCTAQLAKDQMNDDSKIDTAIRRLTKAYTLCSAQNKRHKESKCLKFLRRAKKLRWFKKREQTQIETRQIMLEYIETINRDVNIVEQQKDVKINAIRTKLEQSIPQTSEIPSYLLCKITLDMMDEPVVTEAGFAYEKSVLLKHFQFKGYTDPTTRQDICSEVFECHNLRQAISQFIEENPWSFEFKSEDDYQTIKF